MADEKIIVGRGGVQRVPLMQAEIDEHAADAVQAAAAKAVRDAEDARKQELADDADAVALLDLLQTKTNAEIDAYLASPTVAKVSTALKAVLKILASKGTV